MAEGCKVFLQYSFDNQFLKMYITIVAVSKLELDNFSTPSCDQFGTGIMKKFGD